MKSFAQFFILSLFVLFSLGCGDDGPGGNSDLSETEQIEQYLSDNGLTAQKTSSGLYYVTEIEGSGELPTDESLIELYIRGYSLDGNVFISNFGGNTLFIAINDPNILRGLIEGLRLYKKGSKGTIIMPSSLGFGQNSGGNGTVPPNSPVAYDIEIVDIFSPASKLNDNIAEIETYLTENNITAQKTASNLYYVIDSIGDGNHPTSSSTVTVKYTGYLLDGTVFDSTPDEETTSFGLTSLIEGWREGIQLLSKGGKGTFFIPHTLGYGANPPSGSPILPYGVIAFDIELVDFR